MQGLTKQGLTMQRLAMKGLAMKGLNATVRVTLGALDLALDLAAPPGSVIAVLGPNGAGKTTLIRAIGGLQPLTSGSITVDGEVWADGATGWVPERRRTGWLAADHLLFPHLSALDNVAFGPRSRGVPKARARDRARDELDRLGIGDLADRKPSALSHGQAQRVAIARAFATDPQVLLLDEPLAALDPRTKVSVRATIASRLREFDGVTVMVTHDPLDALTLADELVFLDRGRVVQQGPPHTIVQHPRDPYVAQVAGLNLFRGRATGPDTVTTDDGVTVVVTDLEGETWTRDNPQWVSFPPSAVALYPALPEGSPRNTWHLEVTAVELAGQIARVHLHGDLTLIADITVASVAALRLQPGDRVWATVKATEVRAYPA